MSATVAQAIIPVAGSAAVRPLKAGDALRLYGATSGYAGFSPAATAGSTVWTLPSADGSSGQVLSTNGSGVLSWATAASGLTIDSTAITGGGSGRILFESATGKVSSESNLFWDATNNRLGIGTTTPAAGVDLHISRAAAGDFTEARIENTEVSGYALLTLKTPSVTSYFIQNSNAWLGAGYGVANGLRIQNNTGITFRVGGDDLHVTSTGIGINKTNPGAQLHTVAGSSTTIGQIIQLAAAQTANAIEVNSAAGSGGDLAKFDSAGKLTIAGSVQFDASVTATHTRFLIYDVDNATLERVTVGIADSGGVGFKVLRIAN